MTEPHTAVRHTYTPTRQFVTIGRHWVCPDGFEEIGPRTRVRSEPHQFRTEIRPKEPEPARSDPDELRRICEEET